MPHDHDHDHKHDHNPKQGHDHNCGHTHSHGDQKHDHSGHHHHEEGDKRSYNHGILQYAFSNVSGKGGEWLRKHRRKIILGAAASVSALEYALTNSMAMSSLPLLFAGAAIAHDASEDIMEVTGELKGTHNL